MPIFRAKVKVKYSGVSEEVIKFEANSIEEARRDIEIGDLDYLFERCESYEVDDVEIMEIKEVPKE